MVSSKVGGLREAVVSTLYQQFAISWSSLMDEVNTKVEEVAMELVMKIRRVHFQEGTSKTARTRQIKEVIERHSKKLNTDAS